MAAKPPNIVLITSDQQRADTLGAEGNPLGATPSTDALAAHGTRYTEARTQNPLCQPARASILTGTYPSTHGVTCNGIDLPADAADRSIATLLGVEGYSSMLVGKAHFGTTFPYYPTGKPESVEGSAAVDPEWTGPYFGFDEVQLVVFGHNLRISPLTGSWNWCFGPPPTGLHYARHLFRDGHAAGVERLRKMQPEAAGAEWDRTQTWRSALDEEDHSTTWIADRAIDWLGRVEEPFFSWLSFTDPHHPMDPPGRWFDRYAPEDALEILPAVHANEFEGKPPLHEILSKGGNDPSMEWANPGGANYEREELARMTAAYYGLVAQVDHAIGRVVAALEARGIADDTIVIITSDHGEFMGEHQMIFKGPFGYDSLLRVPLIVRGGDFAAGAVVDDPVATMDLPATILAAAGVAKPNWMEGRNLLDAPREHVLTENDFSIRVSLPMRTLTTDRYKLHAYLANDGWGELYDRQEDPGEVVNRYDDPSYESIRSDLRATLDDVMNHDVRSEPIVGLVA